MIHLSLGFPLLAAVEPLVAQAPALAPVGVIGCDFCNGPEQFSGIQALALDDQGRIYVADRSDPRIRIFAPDGEFIRAFGREGRGPGEMQYVLGIRPADAGLRTIDMRLGRMTRYDSLGGVVSTARLNRFPSGADHESGTAVFLITFIDWRAGGATGVAWWDAEGDSLRVVASTLDFPVDENGDLLSLPAVAATPDSGFVVGDGRREYRIRRYDQAGSVIGEYYRDIEREPRTDEEIEELAAAQRRGPGGAAPDNPEGAGEALDIDPLRNHFGPTSLEFDDRGRLWVRTDRGPVGETIFDVFAPEGSYLGCISVPNRLGHYVIQAGRLSAVVFGEYDIEQVRTWWLIEGGS